MDCALVFNHISRQSVWNMCLLSQLSSLTWSSILYYSRQIMHWSIFYSVALKVYRLSVLITSLAKGKFASLLSFIISFIYILWKHQNMIMNGNEVKPMHKRQLYAIPYSRQTQDITHHLKVADWPLSRQWMPFPRKTAFNPYTVSKITITVSATKNVM